MGCRGTYSIAGLRPCWSGACRRADAAVQIRVLAALVGSQARRGESPFLLSVMAELQHLLGWPCGANPGRHHPP